MKYNNQNKNIKQYTIKTTTNQKCEIKNVKTNKSIEKTVKNKNNNQKCQNNIKTNKSIKETTKIKNHTILRKGPFQKVLK
jgi:hypothetical protein